MFIAFAGCVMVAAGVLINHDCCMKCGFALILTDLVLELSNIHHTLHAIGNLLWKRMKKID